MKIQRVVSIIIPVFNRMSIIAETLESVLNQSYKKWECIIIDDGSTDETLKVIDYFKNKDSRFLYWKRPLKLPKGANSCRNFGFKKSSGDYIIWFDSDDLMTPNHVEKKIKENVDRNLDFVVARTQNFQNGKLLKPYQYEKKPYGIKASDFILLKIHWYTYDVMLKREIADKISWNENMKSWQDYNYFCKMLLVTENGDYLDEVLTHRRLHSNSIQAKLTNDDRTFKQELLENHLITFQDIQEQIPPKTKKELIFGMMNLCYENSKLGLFPKQISTVSEIVKTNFGYKSLMFFKLSIVFAFVLKRGYFLLEKAKSR